MAGSRRALAWLPNAVTSGNLLLGFFSIHYSLHAMDQGLGAGDPAFATACWLILWATIGDVLDGKLAKTLDASSDFGMRLDTFADAVTFGMAPAVLIHAAFLQSHRGELLLVLAPAAYFLAACYRLARYNVQTAETPRFGFTGVPTPTGALITTSLYLCTQDAPLPAAWVGGLLVLLALAMVSPLRYPALKGLKPREVVVILVGVSLLMLATIRFGAPIVVFATFGSFALLWGYWWIPSRHLWVPGVRQGD